VLCRLELLDSMARDRLPSVEESSTLSPPAFVFALELEPPLDFWIS